MAAETQVAEAGTEEGSTDGQDTQTENGEQQEAEDQGPQYVTTTTTVNVRSSDSEQADKLGKVSGGTKLQVLEQRPNGWTKVDYEGKKATSRQSSCSWRRVQRELRPSEQLLPPPILTCVHRPARQQTDWEFSPAVIPQSW